MAASSLLFGFCRKAGNDVIDLYTERITHRDLCRFLQVETEDELPPIVHYAERYLIISENAPKIQEC